MCGRKDLEDPVDKAFIMLLYTYQDKRTTVLTIMQSDVQRKPVVPDWALSTGASGSNSPNTDPHIGSIIGQFPESSLSTIPATTQEVPNTAVMQLA